MRTITEEAMREVLARAKLYSLMILKSGPRRGEPDAAGIIWEHGRRNLALRGEGKLAIVCPVTSGGDVCGIGIFNTEPDDAKCIMDDDPGVKAGIFVYEVHACRSFPGDALP